MANRSPLQKLTWLIHFGLHPIKPCLWQEFDIVSILSPETVKLLEQHGDLTSKLKKALESDRNAYKKAVFNKREHQAKIEAIKKSIAKRKKHLDEN